MKCNNFFRGLVLFLTLLATNTFAQSYVAIAHVIYDGNILYYADNEKDEDLKYKPLTKGDSGTFDIKFTEERLKASAIDKRRLRFGLMCTEGTPNCETYLNPEIENKPLLKELFPEYEQGKEDQPIYEVWVEIGEDGKVTLYDETTKPVIAVPTPKTIRFLAPWTNTGVTIVLGGKSDYMTPITETYCGWFEYQAVLTPKDAYVYFNQTIGGNNVGKNGVTKEDISVEDEIKLDSVLAISDTVWILATMYGDPELSAEFPGELGDCPVKKLPVMMFDWLHGSDSDEKNAASQAGTTSQDFGTGGCKKNDGYGIMKGMVESQLGPNGVPVRSANFPSDCKLTDHLDNWFVPEVVAQDAAGNTYTNATCRELELNLTEDGFWLGQKNTDSPEKGLFFLDDFEYLYTADSSSKIPNPMYDNINSEKYGTHNYGFTMALQAQFEYVKGQYFEFLGDDDVWVFINNKLVVDIGGQHEAKEGKVKLDTLGLTEGETYPFRIFYAERHKNQSNFKMRTSMDLKSEASMFLADLSNDPKLIQKEVWQIVRKKALSCDFLNSSTDTTLERGPSDFVLFGRSLGKGGVALKVLDSIYYAGIIVSNDFTIVTVDVREIGKAQALPPGNYYIRVRLKSNPDEYKDVPFTIDPYELPNLAFASVKDSSYFVVNYEDPENPDTTFYELFWNPFGDTVSRDVVSDTLPISLVKGEKMWAGRSYPVNIMYAEEWATIYSGIAVKITTSTPNLVVCDSMGNPIDEILLMGGHANFYVKATDEVVDGTLTVSTPGAKNKTVNWTKINIKVPPVPQIEAAYIYDRTGDGRADSIWIKFNKPLGGRSVLDSLKFVFGESFDDAFHVAYQEGDMDVSLVAAGDGFGSGIFTGGNTKAYNGKVNIWYTYTDPEDGKTAIFPVEGSLTDMVGPVIVAAEVKYLKDGNTQLMLNFSEGIDESNAGVELFRFHCWKNDMLDSAVKAAGDIGTMPANVWKLIFSKGGDADIVPAVGDSVRFRPPSQLGEAKDLQGVLPHEMNPWVRITGEQKVTVTSPKVVTLEPGTEMFDSARVIIKSPNATVPKLVGGDKVLSVDQVAEVYGTQGHYLGDLDMAELVENEIAEIVKAVQSTALYTDKKDPVNEDGSPTKTYTIEDIIAAVSNGDMSIGDAKKRFGLSPVIVDAYKNGLLNAENVHNYARGTDADVKKIVSAVADKTELRYEAIYYSSLGHYVNSHSGTITCNSEIFTENGSKNCLENDGRLFLAWNMRAEKGRLAATGVYIARLQVKIKVNTKVIIDRTQDFLWGVRRGKVNAIDLGL